MRSFTRFLLAGAAAAALAGTANATTFTGDLHVDNSFSAYLSTNDSQLGTLLTSGSNWPSTYSFSASLTPGNTYYLHIVGDNAEGSSDSGGTGPYGRWDGFLGQFALSDTGFYFSNGGQTLLTNTIDWRATPQPNQGSSWSAPSGAPISLGLNGAFPWGFQSGFSSQAQWIWASPDLSGETFFSTTISGAVPEPASWALMIGGFGLAGAVLRRRRAAVAA